MNKLFRVLTIGSYIPYLILLSYYLTRLYLIYFIILAIYLASSYAVWMHAPFFDKGVLAWVRVKRVCELLLISSFTLRSYLRSQLITFAYLSVAAICVIKLPRRFQRKVEHTAVYVTVSMFFLTNADFLGKISTIILALLIMYEPHARQVLKLASFEWAIEKRIRQYHILKVMQVYMLFLMEYSITRMNVFALLIILFSVGGFNVYAYFTLSHDIECKVSEFYQKVDDLPPHYPLPLDVKQAIKSGCKLAVKVFKTHEI